MSSAVEVVVTGIGLVSALGNLQETWQRLLVGTSAVQLHQPFPELAPQPVALIAQTPSSLLALTHQAVTQALLTAELAPPLENCGVVIGSSRSHQAQWEDWLRARTHDDDRLLPSLTTWLDTLPNAAAIATARQSGCTGPVLAPMAACATGLWAIAQAYELLQLHQCDRVIAGAIEAPISPLTLAGFSKIGALSRSGAYPFDRHRDGFVLGEGGAVLVLETAEAARRRSATVYGQILGFGFTADGYHVSAPDPGQREAAIAVKQCLKRSQLQPQAIGYIHAHGTATQLNDRNEAALIQHLFPGGVAVSSTKGATGHTLGASGAIGVALSLLALKQQVLPPCVGLQQPEFDLDLVTASRPSTAAYALCLGFGFGGQNGAIALKRVAS
ncbi:beta-ketoacyl-ACP synthase [Oculatella sp. LEGE 06141]|uniref:beta-ketoacyl-ACP synthase n=1 Tax=Oculatella sp. LEGE 06141 TaxID=1828648 RepID=UPI00188180BC|nr:beta-ketoacyl-ACP synthase [Oculatella sp. LEGE 06141]MBE9181819.1 beta-ketoacyl-ACP synthase [Oculatella sp. LEGE 06141]